jgi:hypothetical protein
MPEYMSRDHSDIIIFVGFGAFHRIAIGICRALILSNFNYIFELRRSRIVSETSHMNLDYGLGFAEFRGPKISLRDNLTYQSPLRTKVLITL